MLYIPFRSGRNGRKISYRHANRYEAPPCSTSAKISACFDGFGLFQPVSAGICNPAGILFWLFIFIFFSASSVLLRSLFFFFLHLTPTPTRIRVSRSGGGRRSGLLVRVESATALQVEEAGGKMVVQLVGAFNELTERTKKEWFLVQVPCPSSFFYFLLLLLPSSSFFFPSQLCLSVCGSMPFLYSFFLLTFWFKCSLHVT